MYCSELVYVIYKEQFGIEICKPRKVSTYCTFGLGWLLKKRNINPNLLVVAPIDLTYSKYLHNTYFFLLIFNMFKIIKINHYILSSVPTQK